MGITFETIVTLVVSSKRPKTIYFYRVDDHVQLLYNGKVITGIITEIRQDGVVLDTKERKKFYDFAKLEAIKKEEFEI